MPRLEEKSFVALLENTQAFVAQKKHYKQRTVHAANVYEKRTATRMQMRALVDGIYRGARHYGLVSCEIINGPEISAQAALPQTLTLVTANRENVAESRLLVGRIAVASQHLQYDEQRDEIRFDASDGAYLLRGHLCLLNARTQVFGTIEHGSRLYSVQYRIKPQRYSMKVARGAAYLSGSGSVPALKWDTSSQEWESAQWSENVAGLTYGVTDVPDETGCYNVTVKFDHEGKEDAWEPDEYSYAASVSEHQELKFTLNDISALPEPAEGVETLYPVSLVAKLSPFANRFDGAMKTKSVDGKEVVYGIQGEVENDLFGNAIMQTAADGVHAAAFARVEAASAELTLTDLLNMTQFNADPSQLMDEIQKQSMEDFYRILQYHMEPELRHQFIGSNPVNLEPELEEIAWLEGKRGTKPQEWYRSLSKAYVASSLANLAGDEDARYINGRRASEWLRHQTTASDVMARHAPLLYERRYKMKYPGLQRFLDDQRNNAAQYEETIDQLTNKLIVAMSADIEADSETLKQAITRIHKIRDHAKQKHLYWALRLFVVAISPAKLNQMTAVVTSGNYEGSEAVIMVQRTAALLNVLDPDGVICGQYAAELQAFQLGSLLPKYIDYASNAEEYSEAVSELLWELRKNYSDTKNPELQKLVEELKHYTAIEQMRKDVKDLLRIVSTSTNTLSGLSGWKLYVATWDRLSKGGTVVSGISKALGGMILLGAGSMLITMFITGKAKWSELSVMEQAGIIMAAGGLTIKASLWVVQKGVALSMVWDAQSGLCNTITAFFSSETMQSATNLQLGGLKDWLVDTGKVPSSSSSMSNAAGQATQLVSRADGNTTTVQKIFGRNLNEFMATRVGALLAAAGIALTAWALAQSKEPLEKASNAMFLVASTLELFATAGVWALEAAGIAEIGGLAVSSLVPIVNVLAVVAMITGVVLMLIFMFTRPKEKSPVRKFAEGSGLFYMPHRTEIEYLQFYKPASEPQRSGVAILPEGTNAALYLGSGDDLELKPFDGTSNCAFYLQVDELGATKIGTPFLGADKKWTYRVLGLRGDSVVASATLDFLKEDVQRWSAEVQSDGNYEGEHLRSCRLKLCYREQGAVRRYLAWDAGQQKWTLRSGDGSVLLLKMESTLPQGLTMADIHWKQEIREQRQLPSLRVHGSDPLEWTIKPSLPQEIKLDSATGCISMAEKVQVPVAEEKEYALEAKNQAGAAEVRFKLAVVLAAAREATA